MTSLFSYVVAADHGFAPNPFGGFCTLATCKPVIRRTAKPGDWVVGTGSLRGASPGKLIYAMLVAEVLSLKEYDRDARFEVKKPVPRDRGWRRLGDNIYFHDEGGWHQRPSLHGPSEMKRDLSGLNVLVANELYYFGKVEVQLSDLTDRMKAAAWVSQAELDGELEEVAEAAAGWPTSTPARKVPSGLDLPASRGFESQQ